MTFSTITIYSMQFLKYKFKCSKKIPGAKT